MCEFVLERLSLCVSFVKIETKLEGGGRPKGRETHFFFYLLFLSNNSIFFTHGIFTNRFIFFPL